MTRFLTPAKIGLLALIELYTEGVVPNDSTITVLGFIFDQLLPSASTTSPIQDQIQVDLPLRLDLKAFETLLSGHVAASGLPGRTLWDHFLRKIWDIDSLDALHIFFTSRALVLTKSKDELKRDAEQGIAPPAPEIITLAPTSPFGRFVRRSKVEFERLQFNDGVALWTAFSKWRAESKVYWAKKNGGMGRWAGDKALDDGEAEWGSSATEMLELIAYGDLILQGSAEGAISTDDVEKLLEFQVDKMQKIGTRVPLEVRERFKGLLDEKTMIPSLSHYLNFLDAWRSGDYPASFDNLHRYFDYTMQNRDRLFYQYALMNLAVLQADFGCYDEAVAAMMETVSTARENKDMPCLNFALNWLYHFGKSHLKIIRNAESTNMLGIEREGLAFLRVKAKETGMWTLWSSSLLSEAKLGLSNGESLATAYENILKSSQLVIEKNMKSMLGPQMAMYASFWARVGVLQLSKQYCEIFLNCHSSTAVFEDTLRFTCRLAHLLAERGRYDEALNKLNTLDENSLRSWKANQYWLKYQGIIRLKRDLHRHNLDGASELLAQLLQSNGEDTDPEVAFEIDSLHIDYLIRRTDFGAALSKIEDLSSTMQEDNGDIGLRVRLLTMKANLQSIAGRPQKGFSVAMRAASIAWRARLLPPLWAAMGTLSNILNSLSEFTAASQILVAVLPRALECDSCSLNAQLYAFLVNSHVGIAGQNPEKRKENLTKCLEYIDCAFAEYKKLEDINGMGEMMAKKGVVMRAMGEYSLAEDCANIYLDIKREAKLKA